MEEAFYELQLLLSELQKLAFIANDVTKEGAFCLEMKGGKSVI